MEQLTNIIAAINGIVWGPLMLILIGGTGLYLMGGLSLMPIVRIATAIRLLMAGRVDKGKGDITPFNALMTSLSATVGTGNIVGVATAILKGGPGALFWMWCIALVGMATKYAEAVLAVKFRILDEKGYHHGGPMYYIERGLGPKFKWLALAFAFFGMVAGFGIGNGVQANAVAAAVKESVGLDPIYTGIAVALLVGLVLIGGIKAIAKVAGQLVPVMAILYLFGGLVVIALNMDRLHHVMGDIFHYAFTPHAASGGFLGASVWMAIRFGVARGVFSNEAGLGSAPIAHASASAEHPVEQGMVAMLGTFIDTILICSVTGFVILLSGLWTQPDVGATLAGAAYEKVLPGAGSNIVSMGMAIFAFTTILGWSVYGEKCAFYLFGQKSVLPFRVAWVLAIPLGAAMQLDFVWLLSDTLNAMMALPNLIGLMLLSPVVFAVTKDYFRS